MAADQDNFDIYGCMALRSNLDKAKKCNSLKKVLHEA